MKIIDFNEVKDKKAHAELVNELLEAALQGKTVKQSDKAELRALLDALIGSFASNSFQISFNKGQAEDEIQTQVQKEFDKFKVRVIGETVKTFCKIRGITGQSDT